MNSMQEIEAKFYVMDLKKIERRLQPPPPFGHLPQIRNKLFQKLITSYSRIWGRLGGGLLQPRILETNIRFDLPDACLRSGHRVLRLRQDSEARLTYKDAGQAGQGVLNRREIEFTVEDFEKAKQFLEALGYQKLFEYEKYRTTYILESDNALPKVAEKVQGGQACHIMLDELPYGNFVEIEGENIVSIQNIAKRLDLKLDASIMASYSVLFERVHAALNLKFADLTFANFRGIRVSPEHLQVQPADQP